jgi:HlyD family secretion protein
VVVLAVAGAIVFAMLPKPAPVDIEAVVRGPMRVTVDEDGRTRIKERYTIFAPLDGRLLRITLDPGDNAVGHQTLLAAIEPRDPALLDARARAESQARVNAAQAALDQTQPQADAAQKRVELAASELERLEQVARGGAANEREVDQARLTLQIHQQELRAAQFERQVAQFQFELAQAAVQRTQANNDPGRLDIFAPCDGRVLRVMRESEGVVAAGAELLEFGDPTDLEAVVDVLSSDAVKVQPGDPVLIEHWGGDNPLRGTVRLVEPSGFLKVSALGVEEQRVNVIVDFADPRQQREALGDGYRIEARIVIWEEDDVLIVPTSALFREAEQWAVFVVRDGRAVKQPVKIGRQNGLQAQVLDGLSPDDRVVAHPSDQVSDGVKVEQR